MKNGLALEKEEIHRYIGSWQFFVALALIVSLLSFAFSFDVSTVSARVVIPNSVSISPSQGPVGTMISVSGSGMYSSDGTRFQLGYLPPAHGCTLIPGSQSVTVENHGFNGSFQWPMTATGNFGVCLMGDNNVTFQVATYNVLSASPAQIAVSPETLNAGTKAKVTGTSFLPGGTAVSLTWKSVDNGQSFSLGTVTSDASGKISQTFTVAAQSSTGSYMIDAVTTGTPPAALTASTHFHVNGVSIVSVSTPTVPSIVATTDPSPTASSRPVVTATAPLQSVKNQPASPARTASTEVDPVGKISPLIIAITATGFVLILIVLIAGVLLVRRHRALLVTATKTTVWPDERDVIAGDVFLSEPAYAATPTVFPTYSDPGGKDSDKVPAGNQSAEMFSLDPTLVEAIREAQVSLFAMPRPPVEDKVPS